MLLLKRSLPGEQQASPTELTSLAIINAANDNVTKTRKTKNI